jgi:hypothetical protein
MVSMIKEMVENLTFDDEEAARIVTSHVQRSMENCEKCSATSAN